MEKICSSPTKQGLINLINDYFFSQHYTIKGDQAFNPVTNKLMGQIKEKKNRFYFYY